MMWTFLRFLFFRWNAERAHYLAMDLLSLSLKIPLLRSFLVNSFRFEHSCLEFKMGGLKSRNPVGLAAGFDKDGKWLEALALLGFGHIEVGTVTPKAQEGNPKPRLFRLIRDKSIINRMGFNNEGVEALARRLKEFNKPKGLLIGGNIGKNKVTPAEEAVNDYLICFKTLFSSVDYFTINVSSPNTPGLRQLQEREPLNKLLKALQEENLKQVQPKPLYLKIAPDLENEALDDIVGVVKENQFTGIIMGNTTIGRPQSLKDQKIAEESGGLSGQALKNLAVEKLRYLKLQSGGEFELIGVGGISNGMEALQRMQDGALCIQVYTGFIYEGPWMVRRIKKYLAKHLLV